MYRLKNTVFFFLFFILFNFYLYAEDPGQKLKILSAKEIKTVQGFKFKIVFQYPEHIPDYIVAKLSYIKHVTLDKNEELFYIKVHVDKLLKSESNYIFSTKAFPKSFYSGAYKFSLLKNKYDKTPIAFTVITIGNPEDFRTEAENTISQLRDDFNEANDLFNQMKNEIKLLINAKQDNLQSHTKWKKKWKSSIEILIAKNDKRLDLPIVQKEWRGKYFLNAILKSMLKTNTKVLDIISKINTTNIKESEEIIQKELYRLEEMIKRNIEALVLYPIPERNEVEQFFEEYTKTTSYLLDLIKKRDGLSDKELIKTVDELKMQFLSFYNNYNKLSMDNDSAGIFSITTKFLNLLNTLSLKNADGFKYDIQYLKEKHSEIIEEVESFKRLILSKTK